MQKKDSMTGLKSKMTPAMAATEMGDPTILTGSNISLFAKAQDLHLIELGMGLGVNTAALYTKKGSGALNSSLSVLLRLFAAFPEKFPRFQTPTYESLMSKIQEIDPSFRSTYLGPLLGLEINSSFRLKTAGLEGSAPTVRSLAQLIYVLLEEDPENWWIIKDAVEIEARARKLVPAEKIWQQGGWKKTMNKTESAKPAKQSQLESATSKTVSTVLPLHRSTK